MFAAHICCIQITTQPLFVCENTRKLFYISLAETSEGAPGGYFQGNKNTDFLTKNFISFNILHVVLHYGLFIIIN